MIHDYAFQNESKSETRKRAIRVKSATKSQTASGFGRKCSECNSTIPAGETIIVEASGIARCIDCESRKKNCVICGNGTIQKVYQKSAKVLWDNSQNAWSRDLIFLNILVEYCGENVLAPNDSINHCILPKGHDGFHDTGL